MATKKKAAPAPVPVPEPVTRNLPAPRNGDKVTIAAPPKPTAKERVQASLANRSRERGKAVRGGPPVKDHSGAVPTSGRFKVRAHEMGYYNNKRRRIGDVFVIEAINFTSRWMEPVDKSTPSQTTTAKQALQREHDEILANRTNERRPADETEETFE